MLQSMVTPILHFYLLILFFGARLVTSQNDCPLARCSTTGPDIRFPFRLQGFQAPECGFPGFSVSCSSTNETQLEFQYPLQATSDKIMMHFPVKVVVQDIDYQKQVIHTSSINTNSCLPNQPPRLNTSSFTSVFDIVDDNYPGFTLFNCSAVNGKVKLLYNRGHTVRCLSLSNEYQVLAMESYYSVSDFPMPSCKKMYNISHVPSEFFGGQESRSFSSLDLRWSEPSCGYCESQGKYCRLNKNMGANSTECYETPAQQVQNENDSLKKRVIVGISVGISILCVFLVSAIYFCYRYRKKKDYQRRVARFLEDYKAQRPTRYSYADVRKITSQFKEKLGQGGYGTVYKGKLSNEILVAVKVLDHVKGNGEDFINEVGTIGRVHHVNVVRLIGYCADGYRRALVYEFLPNESLGTYISSRRGKVLGYEKLQQIAIGIAKGLDYLHQGCNQRILHFDVKPQNILLDDKFIPKVADFGLAKLSSKDESMVAMTAARGTIGYIAPEVFSRNYGNVTYKADIYSFGMLLLDMVGGRKKFTSAVEDEDTQNSEIYFPEWMFNQLEKGEEIAIQIENKEDNKIFKILAIVGLWCIQWYPADRPSMKVVIQMLEGEDIPIMPPNPFTSTKSPQSVVNSESSSGSKFYNSSINSISEAD